MPQRAALTLAFLLALSAPAQATQVCGWLTETNKPHQEHLFTLWLQADGDADLLYAIGGEGVVTPNSKSHSPSSGTYILHRGKAESPWSFGTTVNPPARIDITVELHQTPTDVFSDAPTPLLAQFTFRRDVVESEKKSPPVFAKKQCAVLGK